MLTGGAEVAVGWSGDDTGDNTCNTCECTEAGLTCTEMGCDLDSDAKASAADTGRSSTRIAAAVAAGTVSLVFRTS